MPDKLITCWSCKGTGKSLPARNGFRIPCDRCQETGKCPAIMLEWEKLGRERKAARITQRTTLRDQARKLGLSPSVLSQAERGIINPETIPANAP